MSVPYPGNYCAACERGEKAIQPPWSSIVGNGAVHRPSGNVCLKWIKPDILRRMAEARTARAASPALPEKP